MIGCVSLVGEGVSDKDKAIVPVVEPRGSKAEEIHPYQGSTSMARTAKKTTGPLVLPGFSFHVRGNPLPQETGGGPTRLRPRQRHGLAKLLDKKLPGKGRRRIFIGPTGCGKSKLAKGLALADSQARAQGRHLRSSARH